MARCVSTDAAEGPLERLRDAFAAPEPPRGDEPPGASGVLVPLFDLDGGPALLYTLRSANLNSHAGQVSFPGGRVDPGDDGPLHAALRETHEEVGIPPARVDVLGHLTDFVTYRGTLVCAYVGRVDGTPPVVPASPDEVDEIWLVPVEHLLDEGRYEGRVFEEDGNGGNGGPREGRTVHYWHLDEGVMWGITGELTARFLRRAYGWKPTGSPRVIRDVADFMP